LPEPVPLPESPIQAKYKLTGGKDGFLGNPIKGGEGNIVGEQPCMDGKGKFQLFDKGGGIWWHPSTGAFEVHGLIFQRYKELNFEQGGLGYPTSDEKSKGAGADRFNTFQHGRIDFNASHQLVTEQIDKPKFDVAIVTDVGGLAKIKLKNITLPNI
jgi:uncharacterized protein with LGFP repeats